MKVLRYIYASALVLAVMSCEKLSSGPTTEEKTESVSLSIRPRIENVAATKVEVTDWDATLGYYPLAWNAGDQIQVVTSQQPSRVCEYMFDGGAWNVAGENEIEWGPYSNIHQFYGLYPQRNIVLEAIKEVNADTTYAIVSATLPPVQSITGYDESYDSYFMMTSVVDVVSPEGDITMPFKMFDTIVRVGLINNSSKTVKILGMTLLSDIAMSGTYSAIIRSFDRLRVPDPNDDTSTIVEMYDLTEFLDSDGDGDISDAQEDRSFNISLDFGNDDAAREVTSAGNYQNFFVIPQEYRKFTLNLKLDVDGEEKEYSRTYDLTDPSTSPCHLHLIEVELN